MKYYHIDAFTSELFCGNPAWVCIVESFPTIETMQKIAAENRHSETAFVKREGESYRIRYFTPTQEIDLCGHATLSSAFVLFNFYEKQATQIHFLANQTRLLAIKKDQGIELTFPAIESEFVDQPKFIEKALGTEVVNFYKSSAMYIAEVYSADLVESLEPDLSLLAKLDTNGITVTAKGEDCDFVSRFFGPQIGVPEDPGTGLAHVVLTRFWSRKFTKKELHAKQLSSRRAEFICTDAGDSIRLVGSAHLYLQGRIELK